MHLVFIEQIVLFLLVHVEHNARNEWNESRRRLRVDDEGDPRRQHLRFLRIKEILDVRTLINERNLSYLQKLKSLNDTIRQRLVSRRCVVTLMLALLLLTAP